MGLLDNIGRGAGGLAHIPLELLRRYGPGILALPGEIGHEGLQLARGVGLLGDGQPPPMPQAPMPGGTDVFASPGAGLTMQPGDTGQPIQSVPLQPPARLPPVRAQDLSRPQPKDHTSPWAYVDNVLFGGRFADAQDREHQRGLDRMHEPAQEAYIASLSPEQQYLARTNPKAYTEARAPLYTYHNGQAGSIMNFGLDGPTIGVPVVNNYGDGRTVSANPLTGTVSAHDLGPSRQERRKLNEPKYQTVGAGQSSHLVSGGAPLDANGDPIDGFGPQGAAPATVAPPATGLDAPPPPLPSSDSVALPGTRADRNHNPLNLKGDTVHWNGMTGVDSGGFAQFATPADGWTAADKNLQAKANLHGLNTVAGVIGDPKWGWSASGMPGNTSASTNNYIASVSHELGVGPNDPLPLNDPQFRQRMLTAMARVEGGGHSGAAPDMPQTAQRPEIMQPAPSPLAHGGAPAEIQGGPVVSQKTSYRMLTPDEVRAQNLDPNQKYQVGSDGKIEPLPGGRKSFREATPDEVTQRGYKPGTVGQINDVTGEFKVGQSPNESDTKTAGYAHRLVSANDNLLALEANGIDKPTPQLLISQKNGVTQLVITNEHDRQFVQASKEWLAPILRKDTGAAVTDGEFAYYANIYIALPGDTPAVLEQKRRARLVATEGLIGEAGPTYRAMFPGDHKSPSAENAPSPAVVNTFAHLRTTGQLDQHQPVGSQANPAVAMTPERINALPVGTFYINAKGQLMQRGN